jgi:hypothetical protein
MTVNEETGLSGLPDTREQLRTLVAADIAGRPFSELSSVGFDHAGSMLAGHLLLDTLEDHGFAVGDFDAVGALTAAAAPFACAMLSAAGSRGQDLDAFSIDFVFPSIKGPSIKGKKVILLDAWLSEKSYIQTSSIVTLKKGNELNLDFAVVENEGAEVVAIASLIGEGDEITVVNPLTESSKRLPFISVFSESELRPKLRSEIRGESNDSGESND